LLVCRRLPTLGRQRAVSFWTAIAIELPDFSHFLDHIQIEIGDQQLIFGAAGLGDDFAAGIAKITLAVKFADIPGLFPADAVDRADEVSVGGGVGGLLEFP